MRSESKERVFADLKPYPDFVEGRTCLHLAGFGTKPEILKILLDNKADVTARDKTGITALHLCLFRNWTGKKHKVQGLCPEFHLAGETRIPLGCAVTGDQGEGMWFLHRGRGGRNYGRGVVVEGSGGEGSGGGERWRGEGVVERGGMSEGGGCSCIPCFTR